MENNLKNIIPGLAQQTTGITVSEAIKVVADAFPGEVTFSSSFSFEDQVISHIILNNHLPVKIFTLDTGRLFAETYSVWSKTNEKYATKIEAYYPDNSSVEKYISTKGPNAFYESIENRKSCCSIRKVEPLKRALDTNAVWITGLRAEHSASRHELTTFEWDDVNQIIKYHPLLHWSTAEVKQFIKENNIPYNPLHDRGFESIGCAPCTRAIKPGEDFRAGRWWWENNTGKECGLHEK